MAEPSELSSAQLHTLRHMLGINTPDDRAPKETRNYYCANPGDAELNRLMAMGAVRMYRKDSYEWFTCTEAGKLAAMQSHRAIRRTKSQRVYSKFLDVKDCWPDITFRKFLTDPELAETRRSA